MKKNVWTKMVGLALALVCIIGLVACGDKGGSNAAGTYTLQTITIGGMTMDLEQLAETAGVSADEIKVTLDLKSDGNFLLDMSALADTMGDTTMEGTWKESGSNITLEADGDTATATLQDGVITMEEEGMSMTFKK